MSSKGKEVAGNSSVGKRKGGGADANDDKKKRNREVLRFFEDSANEFGDDSDSDSDFNDIDNYLVEDETDPVEKVSSNPGKSKNLPFFPKEEVLDEEEFDRMMEERYKDGTGEFKYPGNDYDNYDNKRFIEEDMLLSSAKGPIIWKVKCTVGRERHSAFCLMQKFVDLKSIGTKLQIISAFSVEHVKGFIYIEAEKQTDVNEACKGLSSIYSSRIASVPENEISHLLSVRHKCREVSEGTWARVKNGKYKGDLSQIVAVNNARKRATVKLIPRIDLKVMAEKFGGGIATKKNSIPAPRLINASELEEYRPLIQYRRDRETGKLFEFFDGMMLKDGYLYKKVSLDSLNCWGIIPTEEELLKFRPSESNESEDVEWLAQLYGEQKKKRIITNDKGGGKGAGSSGSSGVSGFELHDLVNFGRKDFGVIINIEKDESYKILKDSPQGPTLVTVRRQDLKSGISDAKFTSGDKNMKTISVNDAVRVLEGPLQDRQGIVKYIYRHTIFIYDENEEQNGGYFCCKSQMCEKIKVSYDTSGDKCGGKGSSTLLFEDFPSSPKSPLSPKQPWQTRENKPEFNRGDKDGMFSIGQTLRIRVGPLKGYLCRVIAIRRTDVTVKLDSQQKVLTVKCEHLSEVHGKSFTMATSEDPGSTSMKTFDLLGTEDCSTGWTGAAGTSTGSDTWNAGGLSTERSSWPSFPASDISLQPGSSSANPFSSEDTKKDAEDTPWESKVPKQNSSWGAVKANDNAVSSDQVGGWGKSDSWGKASTKTSLDASASEVAIASCDAATSWNSNNKIDNKGDGEKTSDDPWNKGKNVAGNKTVSWGAAASGEVQHDSWGKGSVSSGSGSWEKNEKSGFGDGCRNNASSSWSDKGKDPVGNNGPTWGKPVQNQDKDADQSGQEGIWGKTAAEKKTVEWGGASGSWNKPEAGNTDEASRWMKEKGGSQTANWGNQDKAEGWNKPKAGGDDGRSPWNKSSWASDHASQDVEKKSDSNWAKSGIWNVGSNDTSSNQGKNKNWSGSGGNPNSNWGSQNYWESGSGGAGQKQGSDWGKKSNWNSGTNDTDSNQNSNLTIKNEWNPGSGNADSTSNWNSKSGNTGEEKDSGWGKKGNWNSGSSDVGGSQDTNWGKKSDWSSGSANSNWGDKGKWNSGDDATASQGEDQTDNYGSRPSRGNWRGGRGGSYRGRGGFGGRRGDRDFYGGGRSERGGFGGRNGSDRGEFGRRGRGRGDHAGSWNNNYSGEDNKSSGSWNQGSNENNQQQKWSSAGSGGGWGSSWKPPTEAKEAIESNEAGRSQGSSWKSSETSGGGEWSSWSKGNKSSDEKNQRQQNWDSGSGETSKQTQGWASSSWSKPSETTTGVGQSNASSGGWDKGTPSTQEASQSKKNSWNSSDASDGGQTSSWNQSVPKEIKGTDNQQPNWTKEPRSSSQSGGWGNLASGDQASTWDKSNDDVEGGGASGWNQPKNAKEGTKEGTVTSWGNRNQSGKGGW